MTEQEILRQAIIKAKAHGYFSDSSHMRLFLGGELPFPGYALEQILFTSGFAQAFFPEEYLTDEHGDLIYNEGYTDEGGNVVKTEKRPIYKYFKMSESQYERRPAYQFHLQQLALLSEDQRIQYLAKYL